MRQSMTGFASLTGLRLPEGLDGLEAEVRARAGARLARGHVQIALKLTADATAAGHRLDEAHLAEVLKAMTLIEAEAMQRGLSLAPSTAADVAGLRGVLTAEAPEADPEALRAALLADFDAALDSFAATRAAEGQALSAVLTRQLDEIAALLAEAEAAVADRAPQQAERLRQQLARVLDAAEGLDATRVAQELALIAVKSDITEEIDRLRTHVAAARDLLSAEGAVGRRFDFLMQEFNREANTLCSKSGDTRLTQAGLALKTVIDQMREQVQNVE